MTTAKTTKRPPLLEKGVLTREYVIAPQACKNSEGGLEMEKSREELKYIHTLVQQCDNMYRILDLNITLKEMMKAMPIHEFEANLLNGEMERKTLITKIPIPIFCALYAANSTFRNKIREIHTKLLQYDVLYA